MTASKAPATLGPLGRDERASQGRMMTMRAPAELTMEELRKRIEAAGITIADHRLAMVRKLLSDALVHVRAVDSRTIKSVEPAVRFAAKEAGDE